MFFTLYGSPFIQFEAPADMTTVGEITMSDTVRAASGHTICVQSRREPMMMAVGLAFALSLSQATPPIAAGRSAGRVMAEGGNTPIAGARIMLLPAAGPGVPLGVPLQAVTDKDGRFAFERIAPGDYYVDVRKAGYVSTSDPNNPPPTITVATGQSLDNVVFRLQKGGAITGRVVDANGEPVAEASIVAMRRLSSPVAGDRRLPAPVQGGQRINDIGRLPVPVQGGQLTNDIGEFRVFGLAPGEYFIAAMAGGFSPIGGPNVAPAPVNTAGTRAAMTYYPGTTDPNAAGAILITPGAEVGNIVFTLQTVPAFDISGIVVDEAGSPIAHAMVVLMGDPRSGMFGPGGSAQSQDDGRFVIGGVPAGTYQVIASIMMMGGDPRDPTVAGGSGSGGAGFFASSAGGATDLPAEVVVADADVNNVRVVTRRPRPQ
jgi:hypothetical protein